LGVALLVLAAALVYARRRRAAAREPLPAEAAPVWRGSLPFQRLTESLARVQERDRQPGDAESGDAESGDAEPGDAESGDAESGAPAPLEREPLYRADEALAAWRGYLRTRLQLQPGKISAAEVEAALERRGIENELRRKLKELLARLEALRFQGEGLGTQEETRAILAEILELTQEMEERLAEQ
jgi:hypothetical protein